MKPDTGFVYYTLSSSHYKVRAIPFLTLIKMAKEDKTILRDSGDNFGKPVRQLTVRNQSTKDNIGTLPIFAYATPGPPQQPLNFSAIHNLHNTIMQSVLGGSLHKNNTSYLLLGLYYASVNKISIVLMQITPQD